MKTTNSACVINMELFLLLLRLSAQPKVILASSEYLLCYTRGTCFICLVLCYISKGYIFINYTESSLKLGIKYCISLFIHQRFSGRFVCVSWGARAWGCKNDKDLVPAIKKLPTI